MPFWSLGALRFKCPLNPQPNIVVVWSRHIDTLGKIERSSAIDSMNTVSIVEFIFPPASPAQNQKKSTLIMYFWWGECWQIFYCYKSPRINLCFSSVFSYFHPLYYLRCHHYLLLTHFTCCLMRPQSEQRQRIWHFSSNKCELSVWSKNAAAVQSQKTIHIYYCKLTQNAIDYWALSKWRQCIIQGKVALLQWQPKFFWHRPVLASKTFFRL